MWYQCAAKSWIYFLQDLLISPWTFMKLICNYMNILKNTFWYFQCFDWGSFHEAGPIRRWTSKCSSYNIRIHNNISGHNHFIFRRNHVNIYIQTVLQAHWQMSISTHLKSKDWLARYQNDVSEWSDVSTRRLLFEWASTIIIKLSVLV